ncbi:MAG TPA: hypothetical protein VIN77_13635 [Aurantimonas sp.]|uniref:Uncharacterized protein n=1 Tax=Aurantimonas marianensis TaxID=2920428 RepID=A0A9X2H904_9HYPH|nr:hypothetical protein [Aurantimonas marianensis]MCP3054002.1 hypothetical protein [Aurantimonas marianensis]
MSKLFSLLFLILMIAHLIRPFGLPGLKKRGDFWKIALAALVVFSLAVLIRPE